MILPAGHEAMTDDELVAELTRDGYDDDDARAVLTILTGDIEPPPA